MKKRSNHSNVTRFVGLVCCLFAAHTHLVSQTVAADATAKSEVTRPNILFIYTDDQSHRTVSCYPEAYDWVSTPNTDRLAERGVRFTHAYIGTWCMPSRATMLTGRHPYGVQSMRMEGKYPGSTYDPQQCAFWPSTFRQNGYVTGQIGKWHTGTDAGYGRDWDYQAVWNRPADPIDARNYYNDQLVSFNGRQPELVKGYPTDNYTRWASDFIRGKNRAAGKPWYLWLCYGAVHGPYIPAERHRDAYPDARVPIPTDIFPPREGKPAYMQQLDFWVRGPEGAPVRSNKRTPIEERKTLNQWVRQYHQAVMAIDEGVGRVMKALEETGQLENTLVVFTSDQGFAWGQHGFCTKAAPYDATLRAPLIFSMPGTLPEGAVCETAAGGADFAPTFFQFAGIEQPWQMHGRDLTPLLKNPSRKSDHPVLVTLTGASYGTATDRVPEDPEHMSSGIPWWVFLRKGRFKYIRTLVKGEIEELYDLQTDPGEMTNLALDRNYADTLAEFREATIAELKRTGAGMADRLPPVRIVND